MSNIGEIAHLVRLNLGVTATRLSDSDIIAVYNAHKDSCLSGYEFWFQKVIVDIPVAAGKYRFSYPDGFISLVKALRLDTGETAGTGDFRGVTEQEAARSGIVDTGTPAMLIQDAAGFQLQNIPDVDIVIRMTYMAKPKACGKASDTSYLTTRCSSLLEAFLTYKCASKVGGMMSEAQFHQNEYAIERDKLLDENNLHVNSETDTAARPDGRDAGLAYEGGDL